MVKNSVRRLILTRGVLLPFLGLAFAFCFQDPAFGKVLIIEKGVINHDTVWENEELIRNQDEEEALGKLDFSDFANAPIEGPGGSL
jgi:hypothetical protein